MNTEQTTATDRALVLINLALCHVEDAKSAKFEPGVRRELLAASECLSRALEATRGVYIADAREALVGARNTVRDACVNADPGVCLATHAATIYADLGTAERAIELTR